MSGIVCKVWNINATSKKKNQNAQLTDSIKYILNDEKTEAKTMGEASEEFSNKQLNRECRYIENDVKTMSGAYVGSVNLATTDISEAVDEMMKIKKYYGKTDGRAALHGIISLPVEESKIENASDLMKLCEDVLKELFPDHQAIFAVHTNTENLHVHFIVNSVGLNGKKIHQPKGFINKVVHPCVNKYAEKYGFIKNDKWQKKDNSEESKEKKQYTSYVDLKIKLRNNIDQAIENSETFDEFVENLKKEKFTVNVGKHISLKMEGQKKAVRTYQLGTNYSKDMIIERIKSKRMPFKQFDNISDLVSEREKDIVKIYNPKVLKKYADMSKDEKREVIKQLKEGKNPWRIYRNTNWQMENAAEELNLANRIKSYASVYSKNGSLEDTLNQILLLKKQLQEEKKESTHLYKKYKPLTDIYFEMKEIEKKAYLYEHFNDKEYRPEYERYRELTRRLKRNYGRSVEEIADFVDRFENQLLYANAQIDELSLQYREIKKYCSVHGYHLSNESSLLDVIEYDKDMQLARNGVFNFDVKYYASASNPDILMKVEKSPYVDENGRNRLGVTVTVLSKENGIIDVIDNKGGSYDFKKAISDIEKTYGISGYEGFKDVSLANEYIKATEKEFVTKTRNTIPGRKTYSFTQAINFLCAGDIEGTHIFCNSTDDNNYHAVVQTTNHEITLRIVDDSGNMVEEMEVPTLKNKNDEGFSKLMKIKDKYGFSDNLYTFNNINEAKNAFMENKSRLSRMTL